MENNNKKIHNHSAHRVIFDILRDANTSKYSMTKFGALVGLIALVATVVMSLIIMWEEKTIDHVLIVELIGFILTLLGFKNNFGFKSTKDSQTIITNGNESNTNDIDDNHHNNDDDMSYMNKKIVKKPDNVDDSLKG